MRSGSGQRITSVGLKAFLRDGPGRSELEGREEKPSVEDCSEGFGGEVRGAKEGSVSTTDASLLRDFLCIV